MNNATKQTNLLATSSGLVERLGAARARLAAAQADVEAVEREIAAERVATIEALTRDLAVREIPIYAVQGCAPLEVIQTCASEWFVEGRSMARLVAVGRQGALLACFRVASYRGTVVCEQVFGSTVPGPVSDVVRRIYRRPRLSS